MRGLGIGEPLLVVMEGFCIVLRYLEDRWGLLCGGKEGGREGIRFMSFKLYSQVPTTKTRNDYRDVEPKWNIVNTARH